MQPVDQFRARILLLFGRRQRIARQQHLRLDVNQHRRHVNEFGRDVHIQLAQLFDVGQILRGDLRDRNVVDVDVLLANQIEQQVERAFVNVADRDREREVTVFGLGCAVGVGRLVTCRRLAGESAAAKRFSVLSQIVLLLALAACRGAS